MYHQERSSFTRGSAAGGGLRDTVFVPRGGGVLRAEGSAVDSFRATPCLEKRARRQDGGGGGGGVSARVHHVQTMGETQKRPEKDKKRGVSVYIVRGGIQGRKRRRKQRGISHAYGAAHLPSPRWCAGTPFRSRCTTWSPSACLP